MFGWKIFPYEDSDSVKYVQGEDDYSGNRTGIILYRIKGSDLEKCYGDDLPEWVKGDDGYWRHLPDFDTLKNLKRDTKKETDARLDRSIIDYCPLFAHAFSFERDLLVKNAKVKAVENRLDDTQKKLYLVQRGTVKVF